MHADSDRIPARRLTLDHYLPLAGGDWVRVTGLTLAGPDVVVALGPDSSVRVPAGHLVRARLSGALGDPAEEVEDHMAEWYAGDVQAAQSAVGAQSSEAPPGPTPPRVAFGHPVPELVRDRSLVGVFGGDLDAVLDTLGAADADAEQARERRAAVQRDHAGSPAAHEDGSPPDPLPDELVDQELSSIYAGDLGSVPRQSRRSEP
jgi:hypothetical protein